MDDHTLDTIFSSPAGVFIKKICYIPELQIKKNSCQTLGPASKRVLPDLSTFCQTYFFFRNFLIFHFQYSMIKGTILNKGNNKITEL